MRKGWLAALALQCCVLAAPAQAWRPGNMAEARGGAGDFDASTVEQPHPRGLTRPYGE
jgi:hypothetical protein